MLWMSRTMHFERKETADRHVWHSGSCDTVFAEKRRECCSQMQSVANNHVFDPYVINELKNNQWALVTLEKTL